MPYGTLFIHSIVLCLIFGCRALRSPMECVAKGDVWYGCRGDGNLSVCPQDQKVDSCLAQLLKNIFQRKVPSVVAQKDVSAIKVT